MKFFGNIFAVIGVVLVGITTVLAVHPAGDEVISAIDGVTSASDSLRNQVDGLTVFNAPRRCGAIVAGLSNIVANGSALIGLVTIDTIDVTPYPDEIALRIVDALTEFVEIHRALLNVFIGKHGIFAQFFFTAPVAALLRQIEVFVDALAYALIGLIPTEIAPAEAQFRRLNVTLAQAVVTYSN